MSAPNEKRASGGKGSGNQKQSPDDLEESLRKAIGATVKITTITPGLSYEGILYTACPITHLVAINVPSSTSSTQQPQSLSGSFHVIPVTAIEKLKVVSLSSDPDKSAVKNFVVSQERFQVLKGQEESAIRRQTTKDATRGKGVSKEAQDIFDAVHRTLPTRWHGTLIIVNDAVTIRPPYRLSDCQVEKGKEPSLVQVRKIMEHHLSRQRTSTAPVSSPAQTLASHHRSANSSSARPVVAVPTLPLKGG